MWHKERTLRKTLRSAPFLRAYFCVFPAYRAYRRKPPGAAPNASPIQVSIASQIIRTNRRFRGTSSRRGWATAKSFYDDYVLWKHERGEKPLSMTLWAEAMVKRFEKIRANGIRYKGCFLDPARFEADSGDEFAEAKMT